MQSNIKLLSETGIRPKTTSDKPPMFFLFLLRQEITRLVAPFLISLFDLSLCGYCQRLASALSLPKPSSSLVFIDFMWLYNTMLYSNPTKRHEGLAFGQNAINYIATLLYYSAIVLLN